MSCSFSPNETAHELLQCLIQSSQSQSCVKHGEIDLANKILRLNISPLRFLEVQMSPFGANDERGDHNADSSKQFEIRRQ